MRRVQWWRLAAALIAIAAAAGGPRTAADGASRSVVAVLYAGSLVNVMENRIGPAFDQATGEQFRGFAAGSVALANQIKDRLRQADVFISAVAAVNFRLMGPKNGDWVRWYTSFATSPLVIGYNPRSRFAADLRSSAWYGVMVRPGFRLGRTDPQLDPKGALTVQFMHRAARYYHRPTLAADVLGPDENPSQIFPEETLIGRLETGQLDAGFFYSIEATAAHIPYVTPPAAIALGAEYTVAVVQRAPNPDGAVAFVRFLLGPDGSRILKDAGVALLPPKAVGDPEAVPGALRGTIK